MQREARPFTQRMKDALGSRKLVAGHSLHVVGLQEFHGVEHDAVQVQFWLGAQASKSAVYTFTCTSELSVADNLAELEDFVRDRFEAATKPPVAIAD